MSWRRLKRIVFGSRILNGGEIDPDEIFLDSSNLPQFDVDQFEGRIEKPIGKKTFFLTALVFVLIGLIFSGKLFVLQVAKGEDYSERSKNNSLRHTTIFADRGIIYDRNKIPLAWNNVNNQGDEFSLREYSPIDGISHVTGYIKYPSKDKQGIFYNTKYDGKSGVELYYNSLLSGKNGLKITETDVLGNVQSESLLEPPEDGKNLILSIDSKVEQALFRFIKQTAIDYGFRGGAGVIMDVETGEILALTSYPEYSSKIMTDGTDDESVNKFLTDKSNPFLNRVISGLYIPGSIMKPYIAYGALAEDIIDPSKQIESKGQIEVPNPYNPKQVTIFKDWKVHGWVDMRHAIAVSSNVYFFSIGGGYEEQRGIGITNIEKYVRKFGFGTATNIDLAGEEEGNVPNPEWKLENFEDGVWRLGDTYNSSIGQYGFQVTPIQAVRAVASIANDGVLLTPTLVMDYDNPKDAETIKGIDLNDLQVLREGMRLSVLEGAASGLNLPGLKIAAKTGTAELGVTKLDVNSWVTGFFPYDNPKYAFAVTMERGSRANTIGGTYVMRQLFDWMLVNTPEYTN